MSVEWNVHYEPRARLYFDKAVGDVHLYTTLELLDFIVPPLKRYVWRPQPQPQPRFGMGPTSEKSKAPASSCASSSAPKKIPSFSISFATRFFFPSFCISYKQPVPSHRAATAGMVRNPFSFPETSEMMNNSCRPYQTNIW